MTEKISIDIDRNLYLSASNKLNISFEEFIEYSLIMYLNESDDEYSRLFRKGVKVFTEFNNIKQKLNDLNQINKQEDEEKFEQAVNIINRIHSGLGYIGRNQIRKIANQNNVSQRALLKYAEENDAYTIENFGAMPK